MSTTHTRLLITITVAVFNYYCSIFALGNGNSQQNTDEVRTTSSTVIISQQKSVPAAIPDIRECKQGSGPPLSLKIESAKNEFEGMPVIVIEVQNKTAESIYIDKDLITFFEVVLRDDISGEYIPLNRLDDSIGYYDASKDKYGLWAAPQFKLERNPLDIFIALDSGKTITKALDLNHMFPVCYQRYSTPPRTGAPLRKPEESYAEINISDATQRIAFQIQYSASGGAGAPLIEPHKRLLLDLYGEAESSAKVTVWESQVIKSNILVFEKVKTRKKGGETYWRLVSEK